MLEFFHHQGVEELWVACGTKFGKSTGGSGGISTAMVTKPNSLWRWVAPIYTQSRIGYDYCRKILPQPPDIKINNSTLSITIPSLSARFECYHAQKPESLEGFAVNGYCFDEAAKIKEEAYTSARTTQTVTGRKIMLFSTPFGKNWFYRKCMEAREEMMWAIGQGKTPKKMFITARTDENPMVPKEVIETAKKELPFRLFAQYYLAEFMDDGSVFLGFRDCFYTMPIHLPGGEHQIWVNEDLAKEASVVIGADWAKTLDWTVFFAIDLATRKIVGFERLHKRSYTEQIRQLVRFSKKFKEVQTVWHDKSGVGQAIDDQLAYTDLPYRGVTFTNAWKSEAVSRLMTSTEQKALGLPRWRILEQELDAYEVIMTASGNLTYSAPAGQHDDTVSALLLAHSAMLEYVDRSLDVSFTDDVTDKTEPGKIEVTPLEAYYNDLVVDNE